MDALRTSVAALVAGGHELILDLVLLDETDRANWRAAIAEADVVWIGVVCPLDVLEERERARRDRVVGLARAQVAMVHDDMTYDLVIDTSKLTASDAAALILTAAWPAPTSARGQT